MPIAAAGLTYPKGEIRADWFPGENLQNNFAGGDDNPGWIADGYQRAADEAVSAGTASDRVARAYAYRVAYRAVAARLAGTPDSVSLEDLSRTTSNGRVKFFADKALEWEKALEAAILAGQESPAPTPASMPLASRAMRNNFVF